MRVEVSLGAIKANYEAISRLGKPVIPMIKADAYGHGAIRVARALKAECVGVATEDEGIPIRELGREVLVTAPSFMRAEILRSYDMIPMVGEEILARALVREKVPRCCLTVNSGMNRLGFTGEKECAEAAAFLLDHGVRIVGIATHYKGESAEIVLAQNAAFDRAVAAIRGVAAERGVYPIPTNVTGSGAPYARSYDALRVGLPLYGYFSGEYGTEIRLRRAMEVSSIVLKSKSISAGETLGYAGVFRADRSLRAYTVLGGYADGVSRADVGGEVVAAGRRLEIAAVSMDSFEMISDRVDLRVGERVIILSEEVNAERIAAHRGTIPYEVLLGYDAPRSDRVYVD